tara:strand:+ start:478 stop:675 length:198 start_codon:yes stop_codon:yes gene_type:complete
LEGKSKNPYTDAIFSVISQYSHLSENTEKKRVPKVMAEKTNNKFDPVSRWLKKQGIERKDFEGIM